MPFITSVRSSGLAGYKTILGQQVIFYDEISMVSEVKGPRVVPQLYAPVGVYGWITPEVFSQYSIRVPAKTVEDATYAFFPSRNIILLLTPEFAPSTLPVNDNSIAVNKKEGSIDKGVNFSVQDRTKTASNEAGLGSLIPNDFALLKGKANPFVQASAFALLGWYLFDRDK